MLFQIFIIRVLIILRLWSRNRVSLSINLCCKFHLKKKSSATPERWTLDIFHSKALCSLLQTQK